jgi:hypothetical protein
MSFLDCLVDKDDVSARLRLPNFSALVCSRYSTIFFGIGSLPLGAVASLGVV